MARSLGVGLVLTGLLVGAAPAVSAQGASQLPEGVTPEMVAQGSTLYSGAGGCQMCHGPAGKGTGMAQPMTDTTWNYIKAGTFEALVSVITEGLTPAQTGKMGMPGAAAKKLTDEQVKAIAAYVFTLSKP